MRLLYSITIYACARTRDFDLIRAQTIMAGVSFFTLYDNAATRARRRNCAIACHDPARAIRREDVYVYSSRCRNYILYCDPAGNARKYFYYSPHAGNIEDDPPQWTSKNAPIYICIYQPRGLQWILRSLRTLIERVMLAYALPVVLDIQRTIALRVLQKSKTYQCTIGAIKRGYTI